MRGVEVVLRRHDLVVRAQREPRVEEPEPHRGRVGEGDLGRRSAEEPPGGLARRRAQPVARAVQVLDRVRVEPLPVRCDRVPHRARVRREQEGREVDRRGIERELRPHRAPVAEVGRRLRGLGARTERERAGGQTGTCEDLTPRELGHGPRLRDDAVHLEALCVLAVHVHAVDAREIPDVLGIGIAPVLL